MDDDEERLMAEYGIESETRNVFRYAGYRYERLADAVNYAKAQRSMSTESGRVKTRSKHGE